MAVNYPERHINDFVKSRNYLSKTERIYAHLVSCPKEISPSDYNTRINNFLDKITTERAVDLYFKIYPHWIIKNRFGFAIKRREALDVQNQINHNVRRCQKEAKDFSQKITTSKTDYVRFIPVHNDIREYIKALEDNGYEFENDFGVLIIRLR